MENNTKTLLIFVPTFPVLSETFIQREIAQLSKIATNYQVQVLSLSAGSAGSAPVTGVRTLYKRVTPLDIVLGLFNARYPVVARLLSVGFRNKSRSKLSSLYLFLKSLGYAHITRNLHVSHIHAHFLSESSTLMYYVAELLDLPFSISAHARDVFATSSVVAQKPELVPEKAKRASFIVVCNKKAWDKCIELVGPACAAKVLLHYHGLDPALLPSRAVAAATNRPLRIVSVGRFVEKKGFIYLIEAASVLKNQGFAFEIDIIGSGPLWDTASRRIDQLGVGDQVSLPGGGKGMSNDDVLSYMSKADIFVLPSVETSEGDAEGVPNTIVEAAFLGLPIVSTTTGSIADFLHNGVSGLLVPPRDANVLASSIKTLANNPEMATELGQQAKNDAYRMFDITHNIIELDKLFTENLASN